MVPVKDRVSLHAPGATTSEVAGSLSNISKVKERPSGVRWLDRRDAARVADRTPSAAGDFRR